MTRLDALRAALFCGVDTVALTIVATVIAHRAGPAASAEAFRVGAGLFVAGTVGRYLTLRRLARAGTE